MKTVETNKKGMEYCNTFLNGKKLKKIQLPIWYYEGNFNYYSDGDSVYYFSKPGGKCLSGYFSDIRYFKRFFCDELLKRANKKGLLKNLSIIQISGIEIYVNNFIKNQIS